MATLLGLLRAGLGLQQSFPLPFPATDAYNSSSSFQLTIISIITIISAPQSSRPRQSRLLSPRLAALGSSPSRTPRQLSAPRRPRAPPALPRCPASLREPATRTADAAPPKTVRLVPSGRRGRGGRSPTRRGQTAPSENRRAPTRNPCGTPPPAPPPRDVIIQRGLSVTGSVEDRARHLTLDCRGGLRHRRQRLTLQSNAFAISRSVSSLLPFHSTSQAYWIPSSAVDYPFLRLAVHFVAVCTGLQRPFLATDFLKPQHRLTPLPPCPLWPPLLRPCAGHPSPRPNTRHVSPRSPPQKLEQLEQDERCEAAEPRL